MDSHYVDQAGLELLAQVILLIGLATEPGLKFFWEGGSGSSVKALSSNYSTTRKNKTKQNTFFSF
jgi:hypothetical protein